MGDEQPFVRGGGGGGGGGGMGGMRGDGSSSSTREAMEQYEEYLFCVNRGIADAVFQGLLPRWYVDEVLRPWVPYSKTRLLDG